LNMKKTTALTHQHKHHEKYLIVDWGVSNVCNYRCSYCPPRTHQGDFPFMPIEKILAFSKRINDHYADKLNKKVFFLYTGGEVTLFKDFMTLIKVQRAAGNKIGISTNGSKDLAFWNEAGRYLDNVSLSFHEEFTRLDHFINVINTVKNLTTTHVNIMIRSGQVDNCIKTAYAVLDATDEITIDLQIVLKDFKEPFEYTDAERARILEACSDISSRYKLTGERETYRGLMKLVYDDHSTELIKAGDIITRKMNSWQGWRCNIGLELLVIDINGDIYRSWCGQDKKIGNIGDEHIAFPHAPYICPAQWCPGGITDMMISKTSFVTAQN
jgi:MoaA/NifB/PqqE/SkfB family radical SAM enzyme